MQVVRESPQASESRANAYRTVAGRSEGIAPEPGQRRRRRFTDEPDAGGGSSSAAPAPQRRKFTEGAAGAADDPAAWGADGGLLSAEDWGKLASNVEDTEEETRTKFEQEQLEVSGRTYESGCVPPRAGPPPPPFTSSHPKYACGCAASVSPHGFSSGAHDCITGCPASHVSRSPAHTSHTALARALPSHTRHVNRHA